MIDGKIFQIPLSLAVVNPIPTARERETIVIFLCEKPQEAIICTPDVRIEPNIIMVHPPTTESGSEAKKFPIGGSSPARIIHTAPVIMVKRFTTFVMATSPTFCEKDVTGRTSEQRRDCGGINHHRRENRKFLFRRSHGPSPEETSAEVSPNGLCRRYQEDNTGGNNGSCMEFRFYGK